MADLPQQEIFKFYTGDGVTALFNFPFVFLPYIPDEVDIDVYVTLSGDIPDPVTDLKTLNVDYSVAFNSPTYTNVAVTFLTGKIPPNNSTILLVIDVKSALNVEFSNAQTFNGGNLDKALAQLYLIENQNKKYLFERALTYRVNEVIDDIPANTQLPILGENEIWKGQGDGVIATVLEENPDVSTLRSDLANNTNGTDGARLVGYYATIAGSTFVKNALDDIYTQLAALIADINFTTGDVKITYKTVADTGWVIMNDGSIGNAVSGATTRANADTVNLFTLLWNNINNIFAPVLPSGRGVSAAADFAANKVIFLPKVLGRALAISGTAALTQTFTADAGTDQLTLASSGIYYEGTPVQLTTTGTLPAPLATSTTYYVIISSATVIYLATSAANAETNTFINLTTAGTGIHTISINFSTWALGEYFGEETHMLRKSEMQPHVHTLPLSNTQLNFDPTGADTVILQGNARVTGDGSAGGLAGNAHNNMQPTAFQNVMIKL